MKNNLLSKQLKQAYLALEGEHFNKEHFQVNGGRLILTTPNARRLTHMAKILLGQNIYPDLMSYYKEPYGHKGKDFYYRHNRLYTMKELHQLLMQAGFKTLSSGFVREGIYWKDNPKKILYKLLTLPILSALPPFRDFLWVVAEKK